MQDFYSYMKDARAHAGLTQSEAAEAIGVSMTTIQNWEGGTKPTMPTPQNIAQIAAAYKINKAGFIKKYIAAVPELCDGLTGDSFFSDFDGKISPIEYAAKANMPFSLLERVCNTYFTPQEWSFVHTNGAVAEANVHLSLSSAPPSRVERQYQFIFLLAKELMEQICAIGNNPAVLYNAYVENEQDELGRMQTYIDTAIVVIGKIQTLQLLCAIGRKGAITPIEDIKTQDGKIIVENQTDERPGERRSRAVNQLPKSFVIASFFATAEAMLRTLLNSSLIQSASVKGENQAYDDMEQYILTQRGRAAYKIFMRETPAKKTKADPKSMHAKKVFQIAKWLEQCGYESEFDKKLQSEEGCEWTFDLAATQADDTIAVEYVFDKKVYHLRSIRQIISASRYTLLIYPDGTEAAERQKEVLEKLMYTNEENRKHGCLLRVMHEGELRDLLRKDATWITREIYATRAASKKILDEAIASETKKE